MVLLRIFLYKIETKIEKSSCYKKNRKVNVLKIRSNLIQETNSRFVAALERKLFTLRLRLFSLSR